MSAISKHGSIRAMGREAKALPALCACPPSCLVLLEKADLEKVQRVFDDEAPKLQTRLRELLSQVRTELGVFERLMYKNKSQHRRSLYYRRLSQVRRDLKFMSTSGLDDIVQSFTKLFTAKTPVDVLSKAATQSKRQHAIDESKTLCTLLGVARLLKQSDGPIIASSVQLAGLLSQTFFMPFAVTMFSCLARFRVLLIQVLYEVITAFNLLSVVWQKKQKSLSSSAEWRSVSVNVLGQSLPVQLVCQWDGVKLCMTEKKPASTLEIRGAVLAEPTPLWFVDDRTGVKYNLPVPEAIEGSSGGQLCVNSQTTLNVNEGTIMVHEVERMAIIGPELEEVLPYTGILNPKEDVDRLSGKNFTRSIETNDRVQDISASNVASDLPAISAMISCGTVGDSEVREASGARNANCRQDLGTSCATKKTVAYISVTRKICLDSTTMGNRAQNLQCDSKGDGAHIGGEQEVKGNADKISGSEDDRRSSRDKGNDARTDTILIEDRAHSIPCILPLSGRPSSMELVASGISNQDVEELELKQEITDAPIPPNTCVECHGLKSAHLDESDRTNDQNKYVQVNVAADSSRPLGNVDVKDTFTASVENRALVQDIVQMASSKLRTTVNHNVENCGANVIEVHMQGKGSMMTLHHHDTNGDGAVSTKGFKVNETTIESSPDGVGDQNASSDVVLNGLGTAALEYKAGRTAALSFPTKAEGGPDAVSQCLQATVQFERAPNQVGKEIRNGAEVNDAKNSSRLCKKDISLKKSVAYISVSHGFTSRSLSKEDKTVAEDHQEVSHSHLTDLPKQVELEQAAKQSLRRNERTFTPEKTQRAQRGMKRPAEYVSVGPDVKAPKKKRKDVLSLISQVKEEITQSDGKQWLPSGLQDSSAKAETKKRNIDRNDAPRESESAKQCLGRNARTSTPNKAQIAKGGMKRHVAYVSVGCDIKAQKKKRKGEVPRQTARVKEITHSDRKQRLQSGLQDKTAKLETNRADVNRKDATREFESKKKKAHDIFAMLLGGLD